MPRVDRLWPYLKTIWSGLILSILIGIATNSIFSALQGEEWRPTATAKSFIWNHLVHFLIPTLLFVALTALSLWDKRRRVDDRLLARAMVTRVEDVRPGLRSENADISIADYKSDIYLERESDQAASNALEACNAVIVIGRPLSGKSRTVWELMRQTPQSVVVSPRENVPPSFSDDGLRGKDVLLFVDDLHLNAPTIDLTGWINRLENASARSFRLFCTSRDGADWARVEEHQRLLVQRFGPACRVYTSRSAAKGADITVEEGKQLAAMLNLGLSDEGFERRFHGTPGSLTLDLVAMGERYEGLSYEQMNGAFGSRLIDSLKLLHLGGQPRLREDIARAVAEELRGNQPLSNETWDALRRRTEEEGFGVFVDGEFRTYRPYLERPECVTYSPSEGEIEALLPLLRERSDYEGLFYLGAEVRETNNLELAKRAYQASADGGIGRAANNLGTMLMEEGQLDEAEAALNRAIELGADLAYGNLGKLLSDHTDRHQDAEDAFRAGAERGIANASFGLGHHLAKQPGRQDDAERAFREAIERGDKRSLLNLGNLIRDIPTRREEARELVDDAIASGVIEANNSLGAFLLEDGRRDDAEQAFRMAADYGVADSSFNLGEMLSEYPDRWDEAEKHYRDALAGGIADAYYKLGVLFAEQEGRESDAIEMFEKAIEEGEVDAYHRLGKVLMRTPEKEKEAETMLRAAVDAGDRLALNSLGVLLAGIEGKEAQAELILTTAIVVTPRAANRNLGILLARQEGRERDAENAFLAAVAAGEVRANLDLGKLLLSFPGRAEAACDALRLALLAGVVEASPFLAKWCQDSPYMK